MKFPLGKPFWCFDPEVDEYESHQILEVSFVDDTCVIILSKSPKLLVCSVNTVMAIIIEVFTKFSLKINFAKGKTECLLKLRGKDSVNMRESLRTTGGLMFSLPQPYQGDSLRVVDHYKHLGSIVCLSECLMHDAQHHSSAALCSYTSLAGRIFGSRCISARLKVHFVVLLVLTRLLYGTQM